MSSALSVLHAGLNDQSRHMQLNMTRLNKMTGNKKTEDSDAFSNVQHKHDDSVERLDYARVHITNK